ncbi:lipocalin family protein [Derxia gummosa]|uniref:Outer membrane lipoprotein Blc n=1 Tax=Derxia gummosa DSM 723 TaxID=1121388 RepID=A0A8B6X8W3_9BURK|nr:lipocalin family protein [Derxia gummosa]
MFPIRLLLAGLLLAGALPSARAGEAAPLATIPSLDLPRYLGRWHEIAKYPNRFQKQCAGDTSADYSAAAPGRVTVVNRCRRADGSFDEAVGEARQIGAADSPKLEVRFAPAWLGFLPFVWGDYWIVALDDDYRLAIVSEPHRDYLWVLSRTPTIDPAAWAHVRETLATQGFDLDRVELSRQGGEPAVR